MVRRALFLGAVTAPVLSAYVAMRFAKLTLRELRDLRVTILEMKRRMSVAQTASGERVSFDAGGDPERYGHAKAGYFGGGSLLRFLLSGWIYDPLPGPLSGNGAPSVGAEVGNEEGNRRDCH